LDKIDDVPPTEDGDNVDDVDGGEEEEAPLLPNKQEAINHGSIAR
jgi:hypothetical protein